MRKKRILLGASWSIIEPLGLFFLAAVAREEGWEAKIVLAREPDFPELEAAVKNFQPDILGFTVYIGNHLDIKRFYLKMKKRYPDLQTVVGGPHPTYFPREACEYADFTVISEGFEGLRNILRGKAEPGIVLPSRLEPFPQPEREQFYQDHPQHLHNPIKNIVTHTGCPYNCTYCYNSSNWKTIAHDLTPCQFESAKKAVGAKKIFPLVGRPVKDIILETDDLLRQSPETQMIFFQDDIFGQNIEWLREFCRRWQARLEFHAQMRFEFADPATPLGRERLERLREAGCNSLTFAIESANPIIRKEVLNRHMDNEIMFRTLEHAASLGYRVRTEQMLGLPRGATTEPTKINLEGDLENLELNVRLRRETGLPTIAWASTLAPYRGTKIEEYCIKHGFYKGDNSDIPKEGYRIRSVLDFPRRWVGPSLSPDSDGWLTQEEQDEYKDKLYTLMNLFSTFALVPYGDKLARSFLDNPEHSFFSLSNSVRSHLYDYCLFQTKTENNE